MIEAGALDEVRGFRDAGFDPQTRRPGACSARRSCWRTCAATLDLDAAVAAGVTATRQFAKRQRTWFRNRMAGLDADSTPADGRRSAAIPTALDRMSNSVLFIR